MITSFSGLVEMMQQGAVPAWLREYVNSNREQIANALREKGVFELNAPNGEQIIIRAEKAAAA
jgi:predicted transcriptional regulator YheO